jgi:hypothetical protein
MISTLLSQHIVDFAKEDFMCGCSRERSTETVLTLISPFLFAFFMGVLLSDIILRYIIFLFLLQFDCFYFVYLYYDLFTITSN